MITSQSLKIIRDLDLPGGASFEDYLFHKGQGAELAIVYAKVLWPDLIEVDSFVLLSSNFDDEYYKRVRSEQPDAKVEETINLTYLDQLFGAGAEDANGEVWEELGRLVCEMWKARAELLFGRPFICEFNWYSEIGDPGVTMYQLHRPGSSPV